MYDERYHVLIREYNNLPQPPVQPQQPSRNVRMIHERKEVYHFISLVPWESNIPQMTAQIYQEQRDQHFAASRRLLNEGIIQKEPCQPADEEIKRYLNHIATSATSFEWPVHIQHSWQIPHQ